MHAKRHVNKAYCNFFTKNENNEFCYISGTTGSMGRHLKTLHSIKSFTTVTKRYALSTRILYSLNR